MSKFSIYLCGAMSSGKFGMLSYEEMNGWRANADMLFQGYDGEIHTINPCHYYNFSLDKSEYTEKEVKLFDLHVLKNSNIVLYNANFPDSIGSAMELIVAEMNGIPIIAYGNAKNHPWIELCYTKICSTLEEAVEHIMTFYYPNH
jgi:L-fucose isomerase-like protein